MSGSSKIVKQNARLWLALGLLVALGGAFVGIVPAQANVLRQASPQTPMGESSEEEEVVTSSELASLQLSKRLQIRFLKTNRRAEKSARIDYTPSAFLSSAAVLLFVRILFLPRRIPPPDYH